MSRLFAVLDEDLMKNSLRTLLLLAAFGFSIATVSAQNLVSFSLSQSQCVGGSYLVSSATFDQLPPSGTQVTLASSDWVAVPTPDPITFLNGQLTQTAGVVTQRVQSTHTVTITATSSYGTASATLVVNPVYTGYERNFIQMENSLTGTTDWQLSNPSNNGEIQAYAWEVSVARGGTVDLYVSTTAPYYDIDIYRLGHYDGVGGRLCHSIRNCAGQSQGYWIPSLASPTNANAILHHTVYYTDSLGHQVPEDTCVRDANWQRTLSFTMPTRLITGLYLMKLTESSTGTQWYVPIVVRDDATGAPYIFEWPAYTDEVYNNWGGSNGYTSSDPTEGRSLEVSFNRPNAIDNGAGWIRCWTFQMISFMEEKGYQVSYTSSNDIGHQNTNLSLYQGFICPGHDEYWTQDERYYLQQAINNNNLSTGFFGANIMYEQCREENDVAGNPGRFVACYKGQPDPRASQRGLLGAFLNTTVWDHVGASQQPLLKTNYMGFNDLKGNFRAQNTAHWIYNRTGMSDGALIPNLVGYEVDGIENPSYLIVPGHTITVVGDSPFNILIGGGTQLVHSHAIIDEYPTGNLMFNAGTIFWPLGLTGYWPAGFYPWWHPVTAVSQPIRQMTINVLNKMSPSSSSQAADLATPRGITGGSPFTATVTLPSPAGSGGASVLLHSNNANFLNPLQSSISIPAGGTQGSCVVYTYPVGADTIYELTATYNGISTINDVLLVRGGLDNMTAPASMNPGDNVSGTVWLRSVSTADTTVSLRCDTSDVTVPATVVVPRGQVSAPFSIVANASFVSSVANVTASLGNISISRAVTLNASLSLQMATGSTGGLADTVTATLASPAPPGGANVTFVSSDPTLLAPYWGSVFVPEGTTVANDIIYTYPVAANTSVQLTASCNGASVTRTIVLVPGGLTGLTVPSAEASNATDTGSVTISGVSPVDIVVSLSCDSADVTLPATVTVLAGQTSATFTFTTGQIGSSYTANVTATHGNVNITQQIALSP